MREEKEEKEEKEEQEKDWSYIFILDPFFKKFLEEQKPCPPEYTQVLIDNFKDILA